MVSFLGSHRLRSFILILISAVVLLAFAPGAFATNFVVITDGSAPDDNVGDGTCHIAVGGCTLHAAIQP